ncbi:RNA-binding protein pop5 [Saccharomyces pastorianus]|uniref:Ribonuclease P/MRP protein subunit POP5 n=1 Tax=Saccharomyces pastorianus TaxID=27292 RepID=A0A6C1E238_SACPS|nr:RNA-binding protein pop5 [Saccharomyces pastorianus]
MVRLKSRYILFEILYPPTDISVEESLSKGDILLSHHRASPAEVSIKAIIQEIRRSLSLNLGDYGSAKCSSLLQLKYFSNRTSTGIIRCHREDCDLVIMALMLMSKIGDVGGLIVNPVKVSGTIKKIEQFAIRRNSKILNLIKCDNEFLINDFKKLENENENENQNDTD